jgi:hypothetical protein
MVLHGPVELAGIIGKSPTGRLSGELESLKIPFSRELRYEYIRIHLLAGRLVQDILWA